MGTDLIKQNLSVPLSISTDILWTILLVLVLFLFRLFCPIRVRIKMENIFVREKARKSSGAMKRKFNELDIIYESSEVNKLFIGSDLRRLHTNENWIQTDQIF